MTHLVVLGLDSREDAERVIALTDDLTKQQLPGRPPSIESSTRSSRSARRSSRRT
jgi:hypothetical protein